MQSSLPPIAPLDAVMPHGAQVSMNILNWIFVAIVLLFALRYWQKHGSSVGIWLMIGGAITTFDEPIVDVMGKVWFPAIGSWVYIKVWGISIPIHLVAVYTWFVGGQAFLTYHFYKKGITRRGIYGLFVLYGLVDILLEVPGLNTAVPMYYYYGNAPLVFMKFPLWWCFCNALMPMMIAAVVYRFESEFHGLRRPLIAVITWPVALCANAISCAPIWIAMNIEGGTMGLSLFAALISLGLSLMVCHGLSLTVTSDGTART